MKTLVPMILILALLCGCTATPTPTVTEATVGNVSLVSPDNTALPFTSHFDTETAIHLSDEGITVNGGDETDTVFTSHDIVYYEERDTYESGNPYGAGSDADKHTAEEADAHTVVNITAPGAYRVTGKLSQGQIRIDLGEDAESDPNAVVELILDNADITCTVAPAILFRNVYECDGDWSTETAKADVDTSNAGAVLVLSGDNTVQGSYVAKVYKDKEGEKKLVKQDGAIYSYMSMNVEGDGSLMLSAENEGLDAELHLTINGGDITIHADNDGINTNEDGVSVTTVNAGRLTILSGLGAEGDGIDSNGFIVINGGTVVSAANPAADSGLDSDLGTYIHGGTVLALGSSMDFAESESTQATMNLQFSQSPSGLLVVTQEDGTVVFAYDLGDTDRRYQGVTISSPNLSQGQTYLLYQGGTLTGNADQGLYDPATISGYTDFTQLQYTGNQVGGPGGMNPGAMPMERPEGEAMPELPEGETMPEPPEGFDGKMPQDGFDKEAPNKDFPEGEMPTMPEGETMPEPPDDFNPDDLPEDFDGKVPEGPGRQDMGQQTSGEGSTRFTMTETVTAFSGLSPVQ